MGDILERTSGNSGVSVTTSGIDLGAAHSVSPRVTVLRDRKSAGVHKNTL